jgi:hypothetical protein
MNEATMAWMLKIVMVLVVRGIYWLVTWSYYYYSRSRAETRNKEEFQYDLQSIEMFHYLVQTKRTAGPILASSACK